MVQHKLYGTKTDNPVNILDSLTNHYQNRSVNHKICFFSHFTYYLHTRSYRKEMNPQISFMYFFIFHLNREEKIDDM